LPVVTTMPSSGPSSSPSSSSSSPYPPPHPPMILPEDYGDGRPTSGRAFLSSTPARDSTIEVHTLQHEYRLHVRLPGFNRDAIILATKRKHILHVVADRWDNGGGECLICLKLLTFSIADMHWILGFSFLSLDFNGPGNSTIRVLMSCPVSADPSHPMNKQ